MRQLNLVRDPGPGPVFYWMSREMCIRDNSALGYAQELAEARRVPPLLVIDGFFATPAHLLCGIKVISGVSDHCVIIGNIMRHE